MATNRYNLSTIGPADDFSDDGFKFSTEDRETIDQLLYIGAEGHKHDGATYSVDTPTGDLNFTVNPLGGSIPASTRVYYKYSLMSVDGLESQASTEFYVDTPPQIQDPGSPTVSTDTLGGTHLPGTYYYVVSAYGTGGPNFETRASQPVYITVPLGSAVNRILLDMPTLPVNAVGFNIYRRSPGGTRYYYLDSTSGTDYTDDGSVAENCNRTLPSRNTTASGNSITINLDQPLDGSTWKLYRTYSSGSYENSLLAHVVEETFENSGIVTNTYLDTGTATDIGRPRAAAQVINSPSKINLETEVQGVLPLAQSGHLVAVEFYIPGPVPEADDGATPSHFEFEKLWVCEYPEFEIESVRAYLGRGSMPAGRDIVVDVVTSDDGVTYASIFDGATPMPLPTVPQGQGIGSPVPAATTTILNGEILAMEVHQDGGGATPTDHDLTVVVYGRATGFTE